MPKIFTMKKEKVVILLLPHGLQRRPESLNVKARIDYMLAFNEGNGSVALQLLTNKGPI